MIGKIVKGKSFGGCIRYVLEDKKLTEKEKLEMEMAGLDYRERAEVLLYNKCYGNKAGLTRDFNEVRALNRKVEKPVLHLSLRLADGEQLDKVRLMETAEACAREFGVMDNQWLAVLHKDTKGQHIHIVANRVGFDGKVASDAHDYRKMAALCRSLEIRYNLKEVLSPRLYQNEKERLLPRHNLRKDKLAADIRAVLQSVKNLKTFTEAINLRGYTLLKGRGICFIDEKKVRIKGSEVGFPLAKIEKVLALQQQLDKARQTEKPLPVFRPERETFAYHEHRQETSDIGSFVRASASVIQTFIEELLRPVPGQGGGNGTLQVGESEEERKKRLRRKMRPNW